LLSPFLLSLLCPSRIPESRRGNGLPRIAEN